LASFVGYVYSVVAVVIDAVLPHNVAEEITRNTQLLVKKDKFISLLL